MLWQALANHLLSLSDVLMLAFRVLLTQVGYVIPGVKDVKACRVGDTWHLAKAPVQALPGFKPIKPMVFAGMWGGRGLSASLMEMNLSHSVDYCV